jgi:anti-anti-sigma factor
MTGRQAEEIASAVLFGPPPGGPAPARRSSIVVGRYLGTVVVTVHGELDLSRAGHLGTILADLIDGQGNLSIVVDLQDATATDADSLWVFTEAAERARRRGATMRLNEPPAPLYQALQLRGLAEFLCTLLDEGDS